MNPSEELNETLRAHHPAAYACLSRVGRRMFFPLGIPAQAQQARTADEALSALERLRRISASGAATATTG